MKTTSKILSILLVLAMVLSIAPFAFAAETATYQKIDKIADLTAGTYKMGGYLESYKYTSNTEEKTSDFSDAPYHMWNGAKGTDLATVQYAYANNTLTAKDTDTAADIELVAVAGKANTYYIKSGNNYLSSTETKNRKLTLGTEPAEWVASNNANGGITLSSNGVCLGTAGATSKLLRSYTDENILKYGVVFFKLTAGTEGGNQGGTETVPKLKDISVALAGANDASFKVKGVVTCIDDKNIYLQDATGAICARMSEKPTDIKLGDTIIAVGKKSVYNGLPQLGSATYEKSTGLTLTAKKTTIGALTDADICGYVSLKDLEVTEVYDNNGQFSSPNITVKDAEGKTIQLYKAVIEKKDGAWTVEVGDVIDVKAAVSIYNKLQLRNTSADEIVVQVKDTTPTPDPDPTPEHEHKLTKVEKVDATTEKEGCKEHYKCECGKLFTDAEGKNETTADKLAIAKLTNTETDKKDDTSDKKDETTGSGYTKVTDGKLVSGTYVLVTSNGYAPTVLEKNWLLSAQPTVSGNKVTDAKNAVLVLTVDGNKVKITDANGNTVINQAKNNKLDNLDGMWNWKYDSATGTFTFDDGVTEEGQTRYLAAAGKNDNKFRAYRNPSSEPDSYGNTYYHQFTLYKLTDGSNVSTGDNTNVVAIVAIMIVAMAGMAVIVTNRKNWNV